MRRRDLLRSIAISPLVIGIPSKGKEGSKSQSDALECQIHNGSITPEMFGAKSDGVFNNKEAIEKALHYAYINGFSCTFLKGEYYSENISINVPVKIIVQNGCYLNFELSVIGGLFFSDAESRINQGWESFSPGTNAFSNKNFKINRGDVVSISLDYRHGGSAQIGNENGIDILNVVDVNESTFRVKNGTRFPYSYPVISKLKGVFAFTGDLPKGSYRINGNFINKFNPGDVIRIENVDGTDSVGGGKFYFEYVKIKTVNQSHIILHSRTIYSHLNPWIIKTDFLNQVNITGEGRIKKLILRNIKDLRVSSLFINRLIISNCYGINLSNLTLAGLSEPSTVNITYCFGKSIIQNLDISNSESNSDNSTLKIMSSPQVILSNVIISDSNSSSKKQSNYSLFIDSLYTPYSCWNDNIIVNNVICERPKSYFKRGIWFYGLRNSVIESIVGADVFLQGSVDTYFKNFNVPNYKLEIKDLVRCDVTVKCASAVLRGGKDNTFRLDFDGHLSDDSSKDSYYCKFTSGTLNPESGDKYSQGEGNYLYFSCPTVVSRNNQENLNIEFQKNLTIEPTRLSLVKAKNSIKTGKEVSNIHIKNNFQKI
ncbi:TPA: hypothetical protein ACS3VH_002678 [Klebsiella oxytoca]